MQYFFDRTTSKSKQNTAGGDSEQLKNSDALLSSQITNSSTRYNESNPSPKKSSPREMNSSAKTLRKLSGTKNSADHSEESAKSKTPSPQREVKRKEYSSSDPAETVSSKKLLKKISSDGKKPESVESMLTKSRHSSPRVGLKRSGTNLDKGLIKDEKQDDLSVNTPRIIVNDKAGSTSSEKDGEPDQFFSLDLKTIISERTNIAFYRRVGVYLDTHFQTIPKPRTTYTSRLVFGDYAKQITMGELNELQRRKIEKIQALVAILEPAYAIQKRSKQDHDRFCRELLDMIDNCMVTSLDACAN